MMKKIILGLAIVLGLSVFAVSSINAGENDATAGIQYQEAEILSNVKIAEGNLSIGMISDEVKELQRKLSRDVSIYPEKLITGYFGLLTQKAVKKFQGKQGWSQTGVVDQDFKKFLWGPWEPWEPIPSIPPIYVGNCTDSDGGINKYVKGKTCQPSRKISVSTEDAVSGSASLFCKTDYCMTVKIPGGGTYLAEYYCANGVMMSKILKCIAGCEDGACVRPTGVTIVEVCSGDADCSVTQFCDLDGCAAKTGTCIEVPELCTMEYNPVCGCDGKTYGNDCSRRSAKVSKKYNGECGTQEQCAKEGDTPGSQGCCAGLVAKGAATVGENGECLYMRHLECLKCGDNFCDSRYENKCNCSEDCDTTIPPVDVQPIIDMIRLAINKLDSAIKLLYALSGQQLTTQSVGGGSSSAGE